MLGSIFPSTLEELGYLLLQLPISVLALSIHEYSHGLMAKYCGDDTADNLGRLTLNPLKHLDLIGTLCMVICGFGWAKPVPINSRNFRNPRKGMALTALAGPASNFCLSLLFALILAVTLAFGVHFGVSEETSGYDVYDVFIRFLCMGIQINIYFAIFNLIPVPPFDGSRIFFIFLPTKWYFGIMKYERFIMIGVLLLLWSGLLTTPIGQLTNLIYNGIIKLVTILPIY